MDFRQLLNWITGREAGEQAPEQAPAQSERRRFQRIGLSDGLVWLNEAGPFSVLNLSYGGIKFEIPGETADTALPGTGEAVDARIQLGNVRFSTRLTICNRIGTVFGCSFSGLTPAAARLVSDFLKPRILGASIAEIDGSRLQNQEGSLRMRWFQGDEGTQIFLWQSLEGEIVKQEYYFLDYIITWNQHTQAFQTGHLRDERGKSGFGRIDPSSVVFFKVPSHRALQMGRKILECAALPADARDQMLSNLVREERRLYQRYIVRAGDQAPRFLPDGRADRPLVVTNLSAGGIAFLTPDAGADTVGRRGDRLSGLLELGGTALTANVHILYASPQTIGGSLELDAPDGDAFARFLAPRLLGQSLEELPAPLEELPAAFRTARAYLHIGLHNTHVISIVAPDATLTAGRISFMDHILVWERGALAAWKCPGGIVFPRDWELPLDILEREPTLPAHLPATCLEMIDAACLPREVTAAWKRVLA